MSNLFENILAKPQREIAGSDTATRFDYQKDWAFSKMLELHIAEEEYLVAFEFHDDVVFLNSEQMPTQIEFCQVKTQKGTSLRKLSTFIDKGKKANSIVGKLYANLKGICKDYPIKLILVSNTPFEFGSGEIPAVSLKKEQKDEIIKKLKTEFPDADHSFLEKLHFYVSSVALDGFHIHLQGQALEIFKKRFGESGSYNVFAWIRLLQGEIRRKNNFPSDEIKTVEELKNKKCLSSGFVNSTLTDVEKRHKNAPDLTSIKEELKSNGWTYNDLIRFDKAFPQAVADYQDPTNDECRSIIENIAVIMHNLDLDSIGLAKAIDLSYESLKASIPSPSPYEDKMYLTSLIVLVYNDQL